MDKKQFMEAIYSEDKELNTFLNNEFCFRENNTKNDTYKSNVEGNIDSLKGLSELEKKIAKSRLKQFEEVHDVSKSFPTKIALVGAMLATVYFITNFILRTSKDLRDNGLPNLWNVLKSGDFQYYHLIVIPISIFLGLVLFLILNKGIYNSNKYRRTAIYVNALLADALDVEKEDSTKDTESKKTEDEKEIENFSEIVETADSETEKELLKK
ncbi:MAG TPA: hypothetical protein VEZ91_11940 [Kurthia gibsonii]|nr:hypothetical protein [Kurthia gibsonii]